MSNVQEKIAQTVQSHDIVMYVKGSRQMPMCGFSKGVMDIFTHLGVDFETVDVLSDPEIREGIKQYTQWHTIPQIFIKGEFVGGFDICRDLFQSGELEKMIEKVKQG